MHVRKKRPRKENGMIKLFILLVVIYGALWIASIGITVLLSMIVVTCCGPRTRERFARATLTWFNWISFGFDSKK